MPSVATSVAQVPRSRIRELAEIAMSMDGVLRLYFGESNLPTPDYIKQAAIRAMDDGFTFYTENAGLPSTAPRDRGALSQAARRGARPGGRDRGHRFRRAGAERGHSLRARSGRRSHRAHAGMAQRQSPSRCSPTPWSMQIPHPLCGDRYRVDFDALEAHRHAAHAAAALHLAFESAGLGGDRRGAAGAARFRPPPRSRGCWPTRSTTASTTPARGSASPCPRFCARPRATMP